MEKISVVIDLRGNDYIESYIEKSNFGKTKIYNKNSVLKEGLADNYIDTFKAIECISEAYNLAVKNINYKIDETIIMVGVSFVRCSFEEAIINFNKKTITKEDVIKILQDIVNNKVNEGFISLYTQAGWFMFDDNKETILDPVNYAPTVLKAFGMVYFIDENIYSNFQLIFRKCAIVNPIIKSNEFEARKESHLYALDMNKNYIEREVVTPKDIYESKSSFEKWYLEKIFSLKQLFRIYCKRICK